MTRNAELRLAVQLAREPASRYLTVDEIVRDAVRITALAFQVRAKLAKGRKPNGEIPALRSALERYDAELIDKRDLNGMVVGAHFRSASVTSGFTNTFFVS